MTTNNNEELIVSYFTLRKAIGWLGVLLPFMLIIGNYCINKLNILNNNFFINICCSQHYLPESFLKTSISSYYYSCTGELFTGILSVVAIFLFCYKGHKLRKEKREKGLSDNALTNLAGISALGVVLFPTSANYCIGDNIRTFISSTNTGYVHFIMAAIFFISLSLMSIINFRRTGDGVSFGKKKYHNTFLFCGIAMFICIALILIYSKWVETKYIWLDKLNPVFLLETFALIFFGISWLIKGRVDFYYLPKKLKLIG
jgi:hypothetical protein